ncbi:hypothetical protein [Burkholderia vietnamiensis]|uniref:hypothetical protein n=1 Tax=Burkholderia vietnamiensis TaxID=60552 RepID=UPI0015892CF6|nr:hypothetical protein [Burkholderia vietnamiensis]
MALTGSFVLCGQYQALLPSGTDAAVVTPPAAPDWTFLLPSAYVKVERVDGSNSAATATVSIYVDATKAALARQLPVAFTPNMSGPNYIMQAYQYLKTLPDYAGLADVLDT